MGAKWQRVVLDIPKAYTPDERVAIAYEIISYIRDRTESGKGPGGKNWSGKAGTYSKTYSKSIDFKIARKSGDVDLKLSGDMLEAMKLISQSSGKIAYGFENGTDKNSKADGNIRGTYGQSKPIAGKARPFLDLTKPELKKILDQFPLNNDKKRQKKTDVIVAAIEGDPNFQGDVGLDDE